MKTGWRRVKLRDVCTFTRGLTYAKADEVDRPGTAVLRATNVDLAAGELILEDVRYINANVYVPRGKQIRKGCLLVCTASGSRAHLGKVALIRGDIDAAVGGFMGLIEPTQAVRSEYLHYVLRSKAYAIFLECLSSGTNINNLSFDILGEFSFELPLIDEQERIVAALDEAFEAIATAMANAGTGRSKADDLLEAETRAIYTRLCDEWGTARLETLGTNLDSRRKPVTKCNRIPGSVPYYGATGVVDHVRDSLFDEDLLLVSEDGANLLMRTYPIAFSITGPAWVNNHAHVLRFKEETTRRFVERYLNSIDLEPFVSGMAQPKLNQRALNDIPIPNPPVAVQADTTRRLDALSQQVSAFVDLSARKLALLGELKSAFLARAFSGKLTGTQAVAA